MYFNTRVYENFTLPAGNYDAVHITIGEGKGHNWWCVCFPPMCFSVATENGDLSDVLSDEELFITQNSERPLFWKKVDKTLFRLTAFGIDYQSFSDDTQKFLPRLCRGRCPRTPVQGLPPLKIPPTFLKKSGQKTFQAHFVRKFLSKFQRWHAKVFAPLFPKSG